MDDHVSAQTRGDHRWDRIKSDESALDTSDLTRTVNSTPFNWGKRDPRSANRVEELLLLWDYFQVGDIMNASHMLALC